jgi:ABC-2 type transport system ATP-binding protein
MSDIALEVRGLTRSFGKRIAVKSLDLRVVAGDVYGFLGPNGAGKTTAMRCILGLIRSNSGTVSIFGEKRSFRTLRHIGAIVETPAFHVWMTGRQNLHLAAAYSGLGPKQGNDEIARVLERVGLSERAHDRAGAYSLGMKQRLAIARALLGRPKLLLLDEPTNGLDPRGMHEVRELIRTLALHDNITVFISSHLMGEVQAICNRVGIIQEGTLRAEGTVDELLAANTAERIVEIASTDEGALKAALEGMDDLDLLGSGASGRQRIRLNGELSAAVVNRRLIAADIDVTALVPETRSLEDVFLEVTR